VLEKRRVCAELGVARSAQQVRAPLLAKVSVRFNVPSSIGFFAYLGAKRIPD
jgi:hypothetical protein